MVKSALTNTSALKPEPLPQASKSFGERLFARVFGVKGSSLGPAQEFEENPMARLKLLLVSVLTQPCPLRCELTS